MTTTQIHASAAVAPQAFAPPGPHDVPLRLVPVVAAEPGVDVEQRSEWRERS